MGGSDFVWCCHMLWTGVHALVGMQIQNPTKMWQGDYNSGTFSYWKRLLPWNLVIYAQELVGIWVLCSCTPRIYGSIALGWERLNNHWSALAHLWGFLIARDRVIMISPLIHSLKNLAGLFCRVCPRSFSSYCHTALWYPETGNFPHAQTNLRHGAQWW